MRASILSKVALALSSFALVASFGAYGATITGTVTSPDGKPFEGAFVQARNANMKMSVTVLSHKSGRYRIENLPAGDYQLRIMAVGYKAEPRSGVSLTADQNASFDFGLQKGVVHWQDLSIYQGKMLFPDDRGKKDFDEQCLGCHGFEARMAAARRDEDGWRDRVTFMRNVVMAPNHFMLTDQQFNDILYYVNRIFGEDSVLPTSPATLPKYKDVQMKFDDEAMNVIYVEYDMPGPSRFPFDANPSKDGMVWIPELSTANGIARLDPNTGEMKEYKEPAFPLDNHTHSAYAGPDGIVWFTEQAKQGIGYLDPKTGRLTEISANMHTHTVRVAPDGTVWGSGSQFSYDPKTGKFTKYGTRSYSLAFDPHGNVWFTSGNDLMMVDAETHEEKKWTAPSGAGIKGNIFNRRIAVDTDGTVWFAEYNTGKIGSFDRATEKFKEYQLPGAEPTPYALGVSTDHKIWYSSENMDYIGCLDPATGKITQYPYVHVENGLREFNLDSQGRMWYASPSNNKVGYLYLSVGSPRNGGK